MSFFQWRRFNFFDIVKDVENGTISSQLGEENVITCATAGRGNVVLGDLKGTIWRIINRHWEVANFPGWEGKVEELLQPRQSPYLLGLGLEGFVRCLKVWNLDKVDKAGTPDLVRCSRLTRPGSPAEPVSLAVSENLLLMAVGYDDGGVVLYRGDCTRDKGHKVKVLVEQGSQVTGMAFKAVETGIFLYIATTSDVLMFNVSVKDRETRSVLDSLGCSSKGLCVAPTNHADTHFVTGQNDAIYCYNPEGRGQCYAFEGKKRLLNWFRGYLTVVSDEGLEKATVTVFDVQNKFIGFSAPIKPVLAVLAEWGSIFLVTQDGKLHQLVEKDTQAKLALLFKKNFYDVAIKIAKNQQYDAEGLVDIFRQYGDHLYSKGDQTGAIDQYVKTIGTLEPSYVIQKFLDAQKIHNLTAYLQALHRKGLASEDHTTLLLNCYTKLKDCSKLDEFIMTKDREVDFDVDIAINVCRQAGYCKHAMALAEKHQKHDLYLKIVLENEGDHRQALRYISGLPLAEAYMHMKKYGSVLIQNVPAESTEFLKTLCVAGLQEGFECNPEEFIHLFINDQEAMVDFLEHLVASLPSVSKTVYNSLIEYQLYSHAAITDPELKAAKEKKLLDLLKSDSNKYSSDQALVLCQLNSFQPGLLYLYQKAELYEQILKHHFASGNYDAGITACRRFGPQNPQLWVTALQNIAQASGAEVPQHQFKEVLDNIEKYRLLSPLLVVSTLSSCPTATLGVVRDYLLRTLSAEERSIEEDKRVIEQYKADSQKIREKIDKLTNNVTIFQSTKCSACNHTLELPTVHFLCQHGYHQHCFQSFSDSDKECPACHQDNKKILDILRSQEAGRNNHDQFHAQLEKAEDGFSIVAEYLGRGMFTQPISLPDIPLPVRSGAGNPSGLADNLTGMAISEGRLRSQGRASPTPEMPSEGRIRMENRGGGVVTAPSEGRMRMDNRGVGGVVNAQSEGRMRAEGRGGPAYTDPSEGRLRAGQASQAAIAVPSDARMRIAEHRGTPNKYDIKSGVAYNPSPQGSLTANLTMAPVSRPTYKPSPEPQVPRKEDITAPNPFGETINPFGTPDSNESLGSDNPFAGNSPLRGKSPKRAMSPLAKPSQDDNPFGENGEDYNEDLNPFAD
eukprot:GFUD01015851.1.p1 GENE.GFUD01015851.1~~GFUD01015851.1.p1  ORF type:complete len:1126 (+),score=262.45 GFUD01015851.1:53-3430(+)